MERNSDITRRTVVALLILILVLLPAEVIGGMAVSPLQQWVTVKPGKEAVFSITVSNTNRGRQTRPCTVSMDVVDFTVSPQGKLSFVKDTKHSRSAVEWISFSDSEMFLEPGESKEINFKVSAPASADGDYWAAIMVKLDNPQKHEEGLQIKLQTASGVFIHVARRNYVVRGSVVDANAVMPKFPMDQNLNEESDQGQASQQDEQERAFKIEAVLKNDGLVAFIANAKAYLYSGNWRRKASVPLYTSRRRVLPDDSRCFTGVMSQSLPAGQYRMRLLFEPAKPEYGNNITRYGSKIIKDMQFTVTDELARRWADNFTENSIEMLEFRPEELELSLNPGRFTTTRFWVANRGLNTISIRCWVEAERFEEGWLKLKSEEFALAPNTQRSVICIVRIPPDAQQGEYNGTICVEVERSGLIVQGRSNVEMHKIPIRIAVNK